jgi:hypothetical protein
MFTMGLWLHGYKKGGQQDQSRGGKWRNWVAEGGTVSEGDSGGFSRGQNLCWGCTKLAVASASNLGVHKCVAALRQRQVSDGNCPEDTDKHFEQDTPVMSVDEVKRSLDGMSPDTEQPEIAIDVNQLIFTWSTNAFKTEWIAEIVNLINIMYYLSPEECAEVENLIREFPDIFALSVKEVNHIPRVVYHL